MPKTRLSCFFFVLIYIANRYGGRLASDVFMVENTLPQNERPTLYPDGEIQKGKTAVIRPATEESIASKPAKPYTDGKKEGTDNEETDTGRLRDGVLRESNSRAHRSAEGEHQTGKPEAGENRFSGSETVARPKFGTVIVQKVFTSAGIKTIVVRAGDLKKGDKSRSAVTSNDTVNISYEIEKNIAAVMGYHELAHYAKQNENQKYIDLPNSVPASLDESTEECEKLMGVVLQSRYEGMEMDDLTVQNV